MIVYKGRLLKKSLNRKLKLRLVLWMMVTTSLLNIAFHLRPIWLQTLDAIESEWCHASFPSFCAPPSEVDVLFDSNLSRRPCLGYVVDLDLLLCTGFDSEHAILFLCHILFRDQLMIKRLSEAMGAALVGSNFSPIMNSIENFISHEKKWLIAARNL